MSQLEACSHSTPDIFAPADGAPLLLIALLEGPVLPCAQEQLELAPLDLLLENAEARLLSDVEHFVQRGIGLSQLGSAARVELLQRVEALLQHGLVGLHLRARTGQALQLVH